MEELELHFPLSLCCVLSTHFVVRSYPLPVDQKTPTGAPSVVAVGPRHPDQLLFCQHNVVAAASPGRRTSQRPFPHHLPAGSPPLSRRGVGPLSIPVLATLP